MTGVQPKKSNAGPDRKRGLMARCCRQSIRPAHWAGPEPLLVRVPDSLSDAVTQPRKCTSRCKATDAKPPSRSAGCVTSPSESSRHYDNPSRSSCFRTQISASTSMATQAAVRGPHHWTRSDRHGPATKAGLSPPHRLLAETRLPGTQLAPRHIRSARTRSAPLTPTPIRCKPCRGLAGAPGRLASGPRGPVNVLLTSMLVGRFSPATDAFNQMANHPPTITSKQIGNYPRSDTETNDVGKE